jgi:hypothetical protein
MGLKYNSTSFSIQLFTLVQTRLLFLGPEWLGREGGRGIGISRDVASGDGAGRARGVVSEGAGRARGTKGGGTGLTGFHHRHLSPTTDTHCHQPSPNLTPSKIINFSEN